MADKTTLEIQIGRRPGLIRGLLGLAAIMASFMAMPVFNHLYAGGAWSLDLVGFLIGMIFAGAMAKKMLGERSKTFQTPEEAAEWVRSREWDR